MSMFVISFWTSNQSSRYCPRVARQTSEVTITKKTKEKKKKMKEEERKEKRNVSTKNVSEKIPRNSLVLYWKKGKNFGSSSRASRG